MARPEIIDGYAARLLAMCLFMPSKLQVVVIIMVSAYFVYRTIASRTFPPAGNVLWALILGGCYLFFVFSLPLTPHDYQRIVSSFCEQRMSFLLLPVIFSFISPFFLRTITGELIYFAYACLISCVLGNVDYFYHYFFWHGGLHHFSHVDYRLIFEYFTGIHPTYMGMYLAFSICILLMLPPATDRRRRIARYGFLYILLVFLLSLLAKSPVIALVPIGLHYAWQHRGHLYRHRLLIAGMGMGIVAACFFIPFARQRLAEIPQFVGIGQQGNSTENSFYDRQMILHTDMSVLKHYWLTGTGPGRILHALNERYFFHSIRRQSPVGYFDPHNEYLFEWLSFGIAGIICFVFVLVVQFIRAMRTKDTLYLYLLIILCTTFFTETVLSRQQGVLFYALFTSLFFFRKYKPQAIITPLPSA